MNLLAIIRVLSKQASPGPAPAFTYVHVCRALLLIGDEGPIGRIELSRRLTLGEGAIRTIIRHLTEARVVSVVPEGCILTRRGNGLYSRLRGRLSKIVFVDGRQLSLDKFSATLSIKGAADAVRSGIEQRDAAIRAGATGACTLVIRGDEYVMPISGEGESRLESNDALVHDLERLLRPRSRDVVVVASASEKSLAEHAAFAAALTLLE